jgi:hypothetical protein
MPAIILVLVFALSVVASPAAIAYSPLQWEGGPLTFSEETVQSTPYHNAGASFLAYQITLEEPAILSVPEPTDLFTYTVYASAVPHDIAAVCSLVPDNTPAVYNTCKLDAGTYFLLVNENNVWTGREDYPAPYETHLALQKEDLVIEDYPLAVGSVAVPADTSP